MLEELENLKELLKDVYSVDSLPEEVKIMDDEGISGQSRWHTYRDYVLTYNNNYYLVSEVSGSTEIQEDPKPLIVKYRVAEVETIKTVWMEC